MTTRRASYQPEPIFLEGSEYEIQCCVSFGVGYIEVGAFGEIQLEMRATADELRTLAHQALTAANALDNYADHRKGTEA